MSDHHLSSRRPFRIARAIALLIAATAMPTSAATITVDTLTDENDGVGTGGVSLRDAINEANGNGQDDTIDFGVTGTITLTADLPTMTSNIDIDGPGEANLTIDGDSQFRAFVVTGSSSTITIRDMKVISARASGGNGGATVSGGGGGGAAGMGAALFVDDGNVLLTSITFEDNQANGGNGGTTSGSFSSGGGGGGIGGNGNLSTGGGGGILGGNGGTASAPGGNGGAGAGGGGGFNSGNNGGAGGFGGGGGAGGAGDSMIKASGGDGGDGGFAGGGGGAGRNDGGGASPPGGSGGTHGGDGGTGSNGSQGFGGGGAGLGGAIFVRAGDVEILNCTFNRNSATGGSSGGGDATDGSGKGGAIYVNTGANVLDANTTFGAGADANAATDDTASNGDDDDVFGTVSALPSVQSMTRQNVNPSNASQVTYHVTFSETVTGVDAADFAVALSGVSGATIDSTVTDVGSGSVYAVTINTGTGGGSVALKLVDDDSIANGSAVKLGGTGAGNADFTASDAYTIDKTRPIVTSITPATTGPTNADSVKFTVRFDSSVNGFGAAADVEVDHDGTSHSSVTFNKKSNSTYDVTVNSIAGDGTFVLYAKANAATDSAGNLNTIGGPSADVTIDNTPPTFTIDEPAGVDVSNRLVFDVTFDEAVTGCDADDFDITATGVTHGDLAVEALDSETFRIIVNDIAGAGTLAISINDAAATDAAGNESTSGASDSVTIADTTGGNDNTSGGMTGGIDLCAPLPASMLAMTAMLMLVSMRRRRRH